MTPAQRRALASAGEGDQDGCGDMVLAYALRDPWSAEKERHGRARASPPADAGEAPEKEEPRPSRHCDPSHCGDSASHELHDLQA
eukprot:4071672-Alexandrium_andersonii.AAC.1